jgi:hypothetical protein
VLQSCEFFIGQGIVDFEAEREDVDAFLPALGPIAVQRASDQADCAWRDGDYETAAYWRRITALFAVALQPVGQFKVELVAPQQPRQASGSF